MKFVLPLKAATLDGGLCCYWGSSEYADLTVYLVFDCRVVELKSENKRTAESSLFIIYMLAELYRETASDAHIGCATRILYDVDVPGISYDLHTVYVILDMAMCSRSIGHFNLAVVLSGNSGDSGGNKRYLFLMQVIVSITIDMSL